MVEAPNPATLRQITAADPGRSTWLTANAGSGKTRVLTDRVARLLLDGVEPQRILCLTYTKAAASEMQNRLFRRLGEWAMLDDAPLGLALAALAVYFFWKKPSSWLERWVFILIFSGGLGNLIDRVLNGYVVDFFATTFMNFAVFNVADCFVCVGAALFVIAVLRQELNAKKEQKAGTDENA